MKIRLNSKECFFLFVLFFAFSCKLKRESQLPETVSDKTQSSKGFALTSFEPIVSTSYSPSGEFQAAGFSPENKQVMGELVKLNREAYDFINEIDPGGGRLSEDPDFHRKEGSHVASKEWKMFPLSRGVESDGSIDKQPAIIFYNQEKNEIRVVFHGTRSGDIGVISSHTGGWATNLDADSTALRVLDPVHGGSVDYRAHGGYVKKFESFREEFFQVFSAVLTLAASRAEQAAPGSAAKRIPKINITGHSQGGAMAMLASIYVDNFMKTRYNADFDNAKHNAISVYAISPAVLCADTACRTSVENLLGSQNIVQNYDESDVVPRLAPSTSKISQVADVLGSSGVDLLPGCHIVQNGDETAAAVRSREGAPEGYFVGKKEEIASSHFGAQISRKSSQKIKVLEGGQFQKVIVPASDLGFSEVAPDTQMKRQKTRLSPSPALMRKRPILP